MNRNVQLWWFSLATLIGLALATRVTIKDNGYENIVVAIAPSTNVNQSEVIISNIKRMFEEASKVLYKATYDRAYFKSVRILIPDTWSHIEANTSSWETIDKADIKIDVANPAHGDIPYTRQLGGCEQLGEYIHLTPNFAASINEVNLTRIYGKPGKILVHEWAHLRYGVFDEYGDMGDKEFPRFYRDGSGKVVPNICTDKDPSFIAIDENLQECQLNPETQTYDENCDFRLDPKFNPTTSLASWHMIDSVELFCQTNQQEHAHRFDAPTKHNAMCGKRSTMDVIKASPDFAENLNPPVDLTNVQPEFHIVRPDRDPGTGLDSGARFVLVADVSGSMALCKRILKLGESVRNWIKNDLPQGSQLGLVQFSSRAHILSELKGVTDMASRQSLMDSVPQQLYSATCIGCGLDIATQMLAEKGPGGIILLVTDGENSPGYHDICDVEPQIIEAGIRVITIAFGSGADKNIERLADLTDGKSYFVRDDDTSEAVSQALFGALTNTYQSSVSSADLHVKLFDSMITVDEAEIVESDFKVDLSVGRNLRLKIYNLEEPTNLVSMKLTAPNDEVFDQIEIDGTTATITVESAEPGTWSFSIDLDRGQNEPLQITITSQLALDTSAPIYTKCWVPNGFDIKDVDKNAVRVHAQVWKGSNPVIGAKVKAYIEKPNEEIEIIELDDNGVGADTVKHDGVYSKYFTGVTQQGRYSLKCQISDDGTAVVGLGFIGSPSSNHISGAHQNEDLLMQDQEFVGNFSRIDDGGSFKVDKPLMEGDAYPPGIITDLAVSVIKGTENVSIHLKWTAPGDELDSGIVSRYEVKYSENASDLLDHHFESSPLSIVDGDSILEGSLDPDVAGSVQSILFLLTDPVRGRPYYVALRAVDKAEKTSPVSNMAAFFIPDDSVEDDWQEEERYEQATVVAIAIGLIALISMSAIMVVLIIKKIRKPAPYNVVPAI